MSNPARITAEQAGKALVKIYVLIGLGNNHWPGELESRFLIDYLVNRAHVSESQLMDAFNLLIKLQYPKEIKHFNKFSPAYLEEVMAQYRTYRRYNPIPGDVKAIAQTSPLSADEINTIMEEKVETLYTEWKAAPENFKSFALPIICDYLEKSGKLKLDTDARKKYLEKSKVVPVAGEAVGSSQPVAVLIKQKMKPQNTTFNQLNQAKALAVIDYFQNRQQKESKATPSVAHSKGALSAPHNNIVNQ